MRHRLETADGAIEIRPLDQGPQSEVAGLHPDQRTPAKVMRQIDLYRAHAKIGDRSEVAEATAKI
jgi:hypothetical protein